MGILRFSDGIEIDTSGPPRLLELHDGWYVLGEGRLIPVKDEEEGEIILYLSSVSVCVQAMSR